MKKMSYNFIYWGFVVLVSQSFLLQSPCALGSDFPPPLSLSAAISQAEENNPELKRLQAAAERSSWGKLEALSAHLPHLSVNYDHFFSSTYLRENVIFGGAGVSFPAAFPQDNVTVNASITLFDGFESIHKYRAADNNIEALNFDLARAKFKLDETVRLAFFRSLAAQKFFEVAQQNVKTLEDHLARAHLTEHAGYGTRFEVLRIDATLEEAKAEREEAENNIQLTRNALYEAMGMEKEESHHLSGELPVLTEADVPKDLVLHSNDREDVKAQQKRQAASEELRLAAKGFWYPSVSLFAEQQFYQFGNFDSAVQANSNFQSASFMGFKLRWNLFDGGYSYAKAQESTQLTIESENETKKILLRLPQEFDSWKRKFYHSISLYRARMRALTQYQESVRLAEIGVKAGSRTHTEMLDAELDLFRARGALVKTQAEAIESLGNLELAVGHKLVETSAFH